MSLLKPPVSAAGGETYLGFQYLFEELIKRKK
jgi:hypothetical protein